MNQLLIPFIPEISILASLQDKGPETKLPALLTAGKNVLLRQAVPVRIRITAADPAVITVVPAVIGKLNQSTDIYIMPVNRLRHGSRLLCGIISERIVLIRRKERDPFLTLQSLLIFQLINQIKHIGNLHCPFTLLPIPTSSQVVCRTFLQYPDPRSSPAAMSPVPF